MTSLKSNNLIIFLFLVNCFFTFDGSNSLLSNQKTKKVQYSLIGNVHEPIFVDKAKFAIKKINIEDQDLQPLILS